MNAITLADLGAQAETATPAELQNEYLRHLMERYNAAIEADADLRDISIEVLQVIEGFDAYDDPKEPLYPAMHEMAGLIRGRLAGQPDPKAIKFLPPPQELRDRVLDEIAQMFPGHAHWPKR